MTNLDTLSGNPRREAILTSARDVFLAYGFSRTTMDDISRAANLSRPALYLHFKNKSAIYRALGESMLRQSTESAKDCLRGDGTFEERLYRSIKAALLDMMAEIMQAPHGAELLDVKNSLAADLVGDWQSRMIDLFTTAIESEARRTGTDLGRKDLSARALAENLLDGLEGMKTRLQDANQQAQAAGRLVRMVALAFD